MVVVFTFVEHQLKAMEYLTCTMEKFLKIS